MAKEKPTTKICKHCASEIPYGAKVCPNCRKKVKGGIAKWVVLGIVVIAILGSLMGGGDDSTTSASLDSEPKEVSQEISQNEMDDASQDAALETEAKKVTTEAPKIEYTEYKVTELFDDLNANALKAEKTHQDEYVKIVGYLSNIDSDGSYIGLGAAEDDYEYLFQNIDCYIQSDQQLDQILEMSTGDKIVVKGQITSIGELLGYSLQIDSIKKAK